MQTTNAAFPTTLVVLDPGLGNASGHHFSTAELLLQTLTSNKPPINIKIAGGYGEWKSKLHRAFPHILLIEHFRSNFYQYHNGMVSLAELNSYINALSSEYKSIIAEQLNINAQPPVFFCHTLDWDHFLALSFAIHQLQQTEPGRVIRCFACLMFSPGCDYQGRIINKRKYVLAKIALRAGAQLSGVSIFVSHYELKYAVESLGLLWTKKLTFHPCFIANWQAIPARPAFRVKTDLKVLLYAGDAKETKGFHLLPALLKANLRNLREDVQLIIQFTCAQQLSPVLRNAIQELDTIAAQEKRVVIYDQYLSEQLLADLLNRSDMFLFNYSATHYADMSSGFLWHLAWHNIPMLTFDSSWITREAQRLGVESYLIQQQDFHTFINEFNAKADTSEKSHLPHRDYHAYYQALFGNPIEWLYQECKTGQ